MRRAGSLIAALLVSLLVAACTDDSATEAPAAVSPFRDCSFAVPTATGVASPTAAPTPVPAVSLPCFTGGAAVALRSLGRPVVINLWASWCGPCRAELPEFQRLADRADGTVLVLGVVTDDTRGAAASLAEDLGVTFPTLFDESGQLQRAVALSTLPVTLFVDARGDLRHVDRSGALDFDALQDLVSTELGVVVP